VAKIGPGEGLRPPGETTHIHGWGTLDCQAGVDQTGARAAVMRLPVE